MKRKIVNTVEQIVVAGTIGGLLVWVTSMLSGWGQVLGLTTIFAVFIILFGSL
jgi:hypothetical protein